MGATKMDRGICAKVPDTNTSTGMHRNIVALPELSVEVSKLAWSASTLNPSDQGNQVKLISLEKTTQEILFAARNGKLVVSFLPKGAAAGMQGGGMTFEVLPDGTINVSDRDMQCCNILPIDVIMHAQSKQAISLGVAG